MVEAGETTATEGRMADGVVGEMAASGADPMKGLLEDQAFMIRSGEDHRSSVDHMY